ncbi:MAG TPA: GAF domain-containing protein [Gemmatimonadaceae bacterium]|nr:GAF domain-containing protein [Gemmatimonadaceae bacterium]
MPVVPADTGRTGDRPAGRAAGREVRGRRLLEEAGNVLGASLNLDTTLDAIAQLALDHTADSCTLCLLGDGGSIAHVVSAAREPAALEILRRAEARHPTALDGLHGAAGAIRSGRPQVRRIPRPDDSREAAAPEDEQDRMLSALGPHTSMCVPLIGARRTIGAITVRRHGARRTFDDDDLEVMSELARRAALALENARLYHVALEARQVAERAVHRMERLQQLTEALACAHTVGEVCETILAQALDALGASAGAVGVVSGGGREVELCAAVGHSTQVVDRHRRFSLEAELPLARAARTGEPQFGTGTGDGGEASALAEPPRGAAAGPDTIDPAGHRQSWVAVPLAIEGMVIGGVSLGFGTVRRLDGDEWAYLRMLARQGAQALERARLHQAEQRSRAEAAAAQRRLLFLAEANALFASSLDLSSRLQQLARLSVEALADYCLIYMDDEAGDVHHAIAHVDRTKEPLVREVERLFRPHPDRPNGLLARVARTGRPVVVPVLPADIADRICDEPVAREAIARLGSRSAIVVPLIARGQVIGSAAFVSTRLDREFGASDLAFAEELVRRAAVAVDNARLYRAALDANQSKANFLAVMSHELRTPLTAILGYAELLGEEIVGLINDEQRDQLLRIRASGVHLMSLIEEILSFARLEAGQELIRLEPIDLRALVEATRVLIEPLVMRKKLRYVLDLPSAPRVITTDAGKVRQILLNLLSNAVKFTDAGEVVLSAQEDGGEIVFEVRDTGIGVSADDLEQIFEPFWQAEHALTRRFGGTGLGLSVARRLTVMLGGELSVSSAVGAGSTFTVRIPANAGQPLSRM